MSIAAPSSSYCSRTLATTDATCSHEVTTQSQPTLLLPSSSSTIAATLSCPPLGDFNPVFPTLLPFTTSNLKIVATLFRLDKLFLKCHIQLNQLWVLMQCSLISGYFHDFTGEQIMMLKVFPNDDLRSTTHD
ncbi:hypothetical protein B296_00001531 [Ensete ventricosum]|uniref:Uncharacterized protein n=1 Tax=Ensete ventricosum TaxID=4639 RepID=A0A427A8S3_ENSVE|nr:hypothetical protein B296_00001531 [Ensete ventricosum]